MRSSRMAMILEVPDEIQAAMRVPEPELEARLLVELACSLYQREILTFGKAAELARLSHSRFGQALTDRGIAIQEADADSHQEMSLSGWSITYARLAEWARKWSVW